MFVYAMVGVTRSKVIFEIFKSIQQEKRFCGQTKDSSNTLQSSVWWHMKGMGNLGTSVGKHPLGAHRMICLNDCAFWFFNVSSDNVSFSLTLLRACHCKTSQSSPAFASCASFLCSGVRVFQFISCGLESICLAKNKTTAN